jgi:hypothetical protein
MAVPPHVDIADLLAELFPGVPAAARALLLGLLVVVLVFQEGGEPVAAARIATLAGLAPRRVRHELRRLIALGLLDEARAPRAHGRGGAHPLAVRPTARATRLEAALLAAMTAPASPGGDLCDTRAREA